MKLSYILLMLKFLNVNSQNCSQNSTILYCKNLTDYECVDVNYYCSPDGKICKKKWTQLKKANYKFNLGKCKKKSKECNILQCDIFIPPFLEPTLTPTTFPTLTPTTFPTLTPTTFPTKNKYIYLSFLVLLIFPLILMVLYIPEPNLISRIRN